MRKSSYEITKKRNNCIKQLRKDYKKKKEINYVKITIKKYERKKDASPRFSKLH